MTLADVIKFGLFTSDNINITIATIVHAAALVFLNCT